MEVGGEIRLGSALFTLVEPHPGHEVAYNRWYERDHFYAGCLVGPWLFAGRRWVATRAALKDLRFGDDADLFGGVRRGSYLAVYWVIDGKHDEHVRWALDQVRWLHANGRMFEHRDHVHTLLYRYEWATGGGGVPPELALDHPFAGLVATMIERDDGVTGDDVRKWWERSGTGRLSLGFAPIPLPPDAPVTQVGLDRLDRRTLLLGFDPSTPAEGWRAHRAACDAAAAVGRVVWSAPFVPTIPGTDAYTDEL